MVWIAPPTDYAQATMVRFAPPITAESRTRSRPAPPTAAESRTRSRPASPTAIKIIYIILYIDIIKSALTLIDLDSIKLVSSS